MSVPPVSVVMTTHNHEAFVADAVRSVLQQTWPNLQIVISDDGSTDATWDIVQDVLGQYTGPHPVHAQRHPTNIGAPRNLQSVVDAATGKLQVLAHGDDIAFPHRVETIARLWRRTGASLISHNAVLASGPDQPSKLLREVQPDEQLSLLDVSAGTWTTQMLGASFAWDVGLRAAFDPVDRRLLARGQDHVLPLRGALLKGCWYIGEPLMMWRQHPAQLTRDTGDLFGTQAMTDETVAAYHISTQLQRLRDVQARRAIADSPELVAAEQRVIMVLKALSERWVAHRSELEDTAHTLRWLPRGTP